MLRRTLVRQQVIQIQNLKMFLLFTLFSKVQNVEVSDTTKAK